MTITEYITSYPPKFLQLYVHLNNKHTKNTSALITFPSTFKQNMTRRKEALENPGSCLLVIFITTTGSGSLGGPLAGNATWSTLAVRRTQGKINVLFWISANNEWRDIYYLLSNSNVTLSNENTGMMDWLGKTLLQYLRMEIVVWKLKNWREK